jgi:hypothetical protein
VQYFSMLLTAPFFPKLLLFMDNKNT